MGENEETTLDLNQVMEEGMDKFQGELDEAAQEEENSKSEVQGPKSEDEGQKTEETITPKSTDEASPPGEQKKEDDEAGTQGDDEKPTDQEAEDKAFRFKSHDEAESGYRHLQAKTTRIEQEAKRLRDDLKKAQNAEEKKKQQEDNDQELLEFITERHEQALVDIDDLDPDSEEYRKDVSRIWAQKDVDIDAKRRAQETEDGSQESGDGNQETDVWDDVSAQARAAEIDPADDYFRMICTFAPTKDAEGNAMPMKDQIDWAITQTKQYNTKQEQQFQDRQKKAAERKSEEHQDENLTLGRSPADRAALKPEKTPVVTIDAALESALEERRL